MALILIVDDEQDVTFLLTTILERAGHEVSKAAEGAEALQRIREARPDAIVTDLMMPVMDGYELIARLRSNPETADIPLLILTANPAGSVNGEPLLAKPFTAAELLRRVDSMLQGR